MDRELSNSTETNMTGTVFPEGARFHVDDKKIFSLIGFLVVSLLLHGLLLAFLKFPQRGRFEDRTLSLSITLHSNAPKKQQFPSQPVRRAKPPSASAMAQTPSLSAYELLQQSEQAIEQQLQLEKQQAAIYQFGESLNDERSSTPAWLTPSGEGARDEFRIEEFPLADGGTFVKLIYANGKTLCFDVRDADPFDPFSIGIWRFSRCRG